MASPVGHAGGRLAGAAGEGSEDDSATGGAAAGLVVSASRWHATNAQERQAIGMPRCQPINALLHEWAATEEL
ncbi:hypothetical protein XbrCFBP1976_21235 [Xanthomonas bromi]|uniref:Uncharacterized protein n=1 Tax=Xanthomonas bromi TaxID=56449 RepID=A0ABX5BJG3_9XANT|nr:hypothetical protein XbrCFBP1976_21235 [Xanthomonas bromi]